MTIEIVTVKLSYLHDSKTQQLSIERVSDIDINPSHYAKPDSKLTLAFEIGRGLHFVLADDEESIFFQCIINDVSLFLDKEFKEIKFKEGVYENIKKKLKTGNGHLEP